jgi:hypothetical protein
MSMLSTTIPCPTCQPHLASPALTPLSECVYAARRHRRPPMAIASGLRSPNAARWSDQIPLPLSTCGRCLGPSSTSSPQLQKGHSAAAVALFPAPFFSSKCCRRLPSSVSTAACPSSSQLDPRLPPLLSPNL